MLRPGEMADAEIVDWLDSHQEELAALGPGRHELAPIEDVESPVVLYVAAPAVARPRRVWRRLVPALAVVALLAVVFFLDEFSPGWQRLSAPTRASTISLFNREASRIAGHPAQVICDVGGNHVGYVQDADGLAEVGGRRMWLTPDVCYRLYRISRRDVPTARRRARRSRCSHTKRGT